MSGDITYREPKLCSDCWTPWSGLGPVCNACKQIAALKNVAKSNNNQSQYSGKSNYIPVYVPFIIFGVFFWLCYVTNWFPLKVMWWVITGLGSVIWWILKVLFYLTVGVPN